MLQYTGMKILVVCVHCRLFVPIFWEYRKNYYCNVTSGIHIVEIHLRKFNEQVDAQEKARLARDADLIFPGH